MYSDIHHLKGLGFKKSQVARKLQLNIKTVSKYWPLSPDDYARHQGQSKSRSRKISGYRDVILGWLKGSPDLSAAQVVDWLIEHYEVEIKERTVRRLVAKLREEHQIPKQINARQYQAVVDPPMGKQMQVDFGETSIRRASGGFMKVYAMGAVLSHSRYRYGNWSDRPLTTARLIQMLSYCFEYINGVPQELVFDQDRLLAVSENYGDIIYTQEFENYKQAMGFRVRLCRANDPESKGRIEAFIKYMKYNFAKNRLYMDLRIWNQSFEDWLDRTANKRRHGTTKKIPAEVFLVEQQYLRPVPFTGSIPEDIVSRKVRKDNTILYNSNRYTVPIGTYQPGLELELRINDETLTLWDPMKDEVVAQHKISTEKGALVRNTHHLRDNTKKINELYTRTLELLGATVAAAQLLDGIRKEKARYVREQFGLMIRLAEKYPASAVEQAINYCLEQGLNSAVDCRNAATYFLSQTDKPNSASILKKPNSLPNNLQVTIQQRSIKVYTDLMGGEDK
jgi:transposase